jgi:saccharopine dehydrogenase-like NADP-dependent oxidoreductase
MFLAQKAPGFRMACLQRTQGVQRRARSGRLRRERQSRPAVLTVLSSAASHRILVVGGSGRVGSAVTEHLVKKAYQLGVAPSVRIDLGSRDRERGQAAAQRLRQRLASDVERSAVQDHVQLDWSEYRPETLVEILRPYDLVIHTAGPFQNREEKAGRLLDACIQAGVAYQDVADDMHHAEWCRKRYASAAKQSKISAWISTGIYPGVSNLMAADLLDQMTDLLGERAAPSKFGIAFSYFTAGSGGAGATILSATYLLLAEPVYTVENGEIRWRPAFSDPQRIDFGPACGGHRTAYLLNLPEVRSAHIVHGVGHVEARFGTAPALWNGLMWCMARYLRPEILRKRMTGITVASLPLVRLVDMLVGARTAVRVDCWYQDVVSGPASRTHFLYVHDRLTDAVGECTAAFSLARLFPDRLGVDVPYESGVWYPEEVFRTRASRRALFGLVQPSALSWIRTGI